MRFLPALLLAAVAQMTPQYPSPMSDTTRPHPRIERYEVPGRRAALSTGTLYLSPEFKRRARHPLLVHLHGDAAAPRAAIGMQQLSEASVGGFLLRGFAGNSAPDHMDHLYAIGELLRGAR